MTAAEHRAEAERLLAEAAAHLSDAAGPYYVQAAQVHATLATVPDSVEIRLAVSS